MTHDPSVRSDPLVTRSVVPGGSVRAGAGMDAAPTTTPNPYAALGVLLEGSIRGLVREYDVAPHAPCRQCGCAGR